MNAIEYHWISTNSIEYNPKTSNSLLTQFLSHAATSILDGVFMTIVISHNASTYSRNISVMKSSLLWLWHSIMIITMTIIIMTIVQCPLTNHDLSILQQGHVQEASLWWSHQDHELRHKHHHSPAHHDHGHHDHHNHHNPSPSNKVTLLGKILAIESPMNILINI